MGTEALMTLFAWIACAKPASLQTAWTPVGRTVAVTTGLAKGQLEYRDEQFLTKMGSSCFPSGSMERMALIFAVKQTNLGCQRRPAQKLEHSWMVNDQALETKTEAEGQRSQMHNRTGQLGGGEAQGWGGGGRARLSRGQELEVVRASLGQFKCTVVLCVSPSLGNPGLGFLGP